MPNDTLTISCVVHGENRPFPIEIESTEPVDELKNRIHATRSAWNRIAARAVVLWKISIPDDDELEAKLKSIKLDGSDIGVEELRVIPPLSRYFSGDNDLIKGNIHVLVQLPAHPSAQPDPPQILPTSITLLREEYFRRHPPVDPSYAARHMAEFQTSDPRVLPDRSVGLASIPVVLLHPIFGQFVDNCRDRVATPEDHKLVRILSSRMLESFRYETARRDAFISIMNENLGLQLFAISGTLDYMAGRHAVTKNGHVYMILPKNELGSGAGDSAFQTASYYSELVRGCPKPESVLPCFHLYYGGELGNWEIRSIFTFIKALSSPLEA
jgi:hypothetical protein